MGKEWYWIACELAGAACKDIFMEFGTAVIAQPRNEVVDTFEHTPIWCGQTAHFVPGTTVLLGANLADPVRMILRLRVVTLPSDERHECGQKLARCCEAPAGIRNLSSSELGVLRDWGAMVKRFPSALSTTHWTHTSYEDIAATAAKANPEFDAMTDVDCFSQANVMSEEVVPADDFAYHKRTCVNRRLGGFTVSNGMVHFKSWNCRYNRSFAKGTTLYLSCTEDESRWSFKDWGGNKIHM